MIHDVLLNAMDLFQGAHLPDSCKPGVVAPFPYFRRHDIGKHQGVKQIRKNEDLHIA